jgi:hypothetical protein
LRTNGPASTRPGDQFGPLRRGEDRGTGAHGVADHDGGTAEFLDQGGDIARCFLVAVGRERGVAVTVAAKIGAGDAVTRRPQGRSEEAVVGPQVTHAGH